MTCVGDMVVITEGPFENYTAIVKEIKSHNIDFRFKLNVVKYPDGIPVENGTDYECDDHEFELLEVR